MGYVLNVKLPSSNHSVRAALIMHFTLINAPIAVLLQTQILVGNAIIISLLKPLVNHANLLQINQIA